MERAVVIKIHGNPTLGNAIAEGMQNDQMMRMESEKYQLEMAVRNLKARIGVKESVGSDNYVARLNNIRRTCPARVHSPLYHRFWILVGTLWLALTEGGIINA